MNPNATHSPIFQVFYGDRTVDLSEQFPELCPSAERAARLVSDPVAGADFFDVCITAFLEKLLGWDSSKGCSSKRGGIFGHLRAYYGTCEYTERGQLHGHFLIWLKGGMNPQDVHEKMKTDEEFKVRFFDFFESIIYYHLPPGDDSELDPTYEPRTECPPDPRSADWENIFLSQVRRVAEALQRHVCRSVCEKYGNEGKCRFHFPHEIVPASYFDDDTNSIVLKCLDPTMNYYNQYISVFCRHNHDLRCILSGKSAKAAMFYITDYITKMDAKTHQTLSLLSQAVGRIAPAPGELSVKDRAKKVLHKCLTQLTRQQQIHAQQAVRIMRGYGDGIYSHETVPVLSSLMLEYVSGMMAKDGRCSTMEFASEEECEPLQRKIEVDEKGNLWRATQVEDYLYRPESLGDVCFWDFVLHYDKIKIPRVDPNKKKIDHPCKKMRFRFTEKHPEHASHEIIQRFNGDSLTPPHERVPRIVGCSIPRRESEMFPLFALVHFKPFSLSSPCIPVNTDSAQTFAAFEFLPTHCRIMKNWEAVYECEDERDADRLKKQANRSKGCFSLFNAELGLDDDQELGGDPSQFDPEKEQVVRRMLSKVTQAGWLACADESDDESLPDKVYHVQQEPVVLLDGSRECIVPSSDQLRLWAIEVKNQERELAQRRRSALNPDGQTMEVKNHLPETIANPSIQTKSDSRPGLTVNMISNVNSDSGNIENLLHLIETKNGLNARQKMSFRIAARRYVEIMNFRQQKERQGRSKSVEVTEGSPLRMFLTGPGGTGKTHVVKSLREVMASFNSPRYIAWEA